jgi:hypothetical protein
MNAEAAKLAFFVGVSRKCAANETEGVVVIPEH